MDLDIICRISYLCIFENLGNMKTYTLDEVKDKCIGEKGTKRRDNHDLKVKLWVVGRMIKEARKEQNLTKKQLGKLVGIQKSQISKLEKNTSNVTIQTVLKVFTALRANVNFKVKLMDNEVTIS